MPQLVISVTQEGHVVSVRRVETITLDDAPAYFPPFALGERFTASLFISATRNSPYLSADEKADAVALLSLFPIGTRVVGEVVPAPFVPGAQTEAVLPSLLKKALGLDSGTFKVNPGLLRFVDP